MDLQNNQQDQNLNALQNSAQIDEELPHVSQEINPNNMTQNIRVQRQEDQHSQNQYNHQCDYSEQKIKIIGQQKKVSELNNSQMDIQIFSNTEQLSKAHKNPKVKREKRKMRNTALYDKSDREQFSELFVDLIDVINQCYTGISLSKDSQTGKEQGRKKNDNLKNKLSKEEESLSQMLNIDNNNQNAKQYTSTRIKRKPIRKYSQQQKQAARTKEQKLKRLNIRKNISVQNPIAKQSMSSCNRKDDKIQIKGQKQKDNGNLSVQEIINRKLQQQRNLQKQEIFKNYPILMSYSFYTEEQIANKQVQPNNRVMQIVPMVDINRVQVKFQPSSEKQMGNRLQNNSFRKLSIENCLSVFVQPKNFSEN